ncbi:MAG: glucoamylase family protein [Spongiibacteraceae bacterium]
MIVDTAKIADKEHVSACAIGMLGLRSGKQFRRIFESRFNTHLADIAEQQVDTIDRLPYARWLLDNSHIVREALQQIQTDLPAHYYRQLRQCSTADDREPPRIFALMDQTINDHGLPIDIDTIEASVRPLTTTDDNHADTSLTLGELWAVPIALRIVLILRLCEVLSLSKEDCLEAGSEDDIEHKTMIVAGCILSLRTIGTTNWRRFVERTSAVEQHLRNDPQDIYRQMDFETRDRYRGVVELLAKRSNMDQEAIAKMAVQLATQNDTDNDGATPVCRHIGYYLLDDGRPQLEAAVGYQPSYYEKLQRTASRHKAALYLGSITGLAAIGSLTLFFALLAHNTGHIASLGAALLAVVPLLFVAGGAVNLLVNGLVNPRRLPKLDFARGIPAKERALVVVPMLLTDHNGIAANLAMLEQNYLANSDPVLRFALLSDHCDAATQDTAEDQALLNQAMAGIDRLNERYANNGNQPFLLFHRQRLWNENAGQWMGWERKRGKLQELNALLRGASDTSYVLQHPQPFTSTDLRYVITLDADSYMSPNTAARLIGTLAHPLNRPRFDHTSQTKLKGYTIIQPRLEANPVSGADTLFTRIFAGDTLLDLYTQAVSDVYQDLFSDAVFTGKGIYDIDAFDRSVNGRIEPNSILSHDLLEGLFGRVGLASDIVVLEEYPPNYLAYLKRLHRWLRGDWQLLPWLFRRTAKGHPFNIGVVGRWKIFDNLRRSLLAPVLLLMLLGGWAWLAENPILWTLVFALFPGLPILFHTGMALRTSAWRWGTVKTTLQNLGGQAGADILRWGSALAFVPVETYLTLDAITRTLYRLFISRKGLLEWSSAATVATTVGTTNDLRLFWQSLWAGPTTALLTAMGLATLQPTALIASAPFIIIWLFSPWLAFRLSRPAPEKPTVDLNEDEQQILRLVARDTWQFFDNFVGPDSAWLPPDNIQEFPARTIAQRTSPTNIGMLLLSTLSAHDLGYIGIRELLTRLTNCLNSITKLETHRGHLFNWYSIPDRHTLEPRYVSTVDSGNFVAALIVLRQAITELPHNRKPQENVTAGLSDHLHAVRRQLFKNNEYPTNTAACTLWEALDTADRRLAQSKDVLTAAQQLENDWDKIETAFLSALQQLPEHWDDEVIANVRKDGQIIRQQLNRIRKDVDFFMPWSQRFTTSTLTPTPKLLQEKHTSDQLKTIRRLLSAPMTLPVPTSQFEDALQSIDVLRQSLNEGGNTLDDIDKACQWLDAWVDEARKARDASLSIEASCQLLLETLETLIQQTDFSFLYDSNRHLFHVGYNESMGELDTSYYDLLASEARLASFVAIAKGDVPSEHWVHLGRPLTRIRGLSILLSWSATAFEYLMPSLIMRNPSRGLLSQSCEGAIQQQIRIGEKHDIPWGVSESGYAHLDPQGNYQYYAFGVPELGLKWDQGERLVVSAYASALALPFRPREVVRNLSRLINLDASGYFGLFEAIDFGLARQPHQDHPTIVRSYMAHHQGMILVAITNALTGDRMVERFHDYPLIASAEYLLYERLPRRMETHPLERLPAPLKEKTLRPPSIDQWRVSNQSSELAILSNGRLSSRLSDQGGGALHWRGRAVTHWDPLIEGPLGGDGLYIHDRDQDKALPNLGVMPLSSNVETYFAPHKVEFRTRYGKLLIRTIITVAPLADVEIRKVAITNHSSQRRRLTVTAYSEPVLAPAADHRRHPAFSKLFLEAELTGTDAEVLLYQRRQREPDTAPIFVAYAVVSTSGRSHLHIENDRERFLGRNGSRAHPQPFTEPTHDTGQSLQPSLDPCAAMTQILEIAPYSTHECVFLTAVGDSRSAVLAQLARYDTIERTDWEVEKSSLHSERELTLARIDSNTVRQAYQLLAQVTWPRRLQHVETAQVCMPSGVQDVLWRHGISGDRPIITLLIDNGEDLRTIEQVLQAIAYLEHQDMLIDVLLLDESKGGYTAPVQDQLRQLVNKYLPGDRHGPSGFIIPVRNISATEKSALISSARLYIDSQGTDLATVLAQPSSHSVHMPRFIPQPSEPTTNAPIACIQARSDLTYSHQLGGMLPDAEGYSMLISSQQQTPAPWCNVLANPQFGTLVSESGSMCTWWRNSSEYRLTPWSNDPVLDQAGEALYIRDEETGEIWSLTPGPQAVRSPYRVTHMVGESLFEHNNHGLEQQLRILVDPEDPIKTLCIDLNNRWPRVRRLTITYIAEWVLGNNRDSNSHLLMPERDPDTGALLVRNNYARTDRETHAFMAASLPAHGFSTDGIEVFGEHGYLDGPPAGLMAVGLSDHVIPSARPCAAYQIHINLAPNASQQCHFVLGAAGSRAEAIRLISRSQQPQWIATSRTAVTKRWSGLLGKWQVATSVQSMDAMLNRWLLYQVISSRLWGKLGFYQASGGFGFRDQLQDILALLDTAPELAREYLLYASSRQFEEGDVLHWWHENPLRGVRTRCSDDLLWLVYGVSEYLEVTADATILSEQTPFLSGEVLREDEQERYAEFSESAHTASIYEHCCRAVDARLTFGRHGLPFIGNGDWCDGLSRVGEQGRGESVWMAWFLIAVCRQFAPLCRIMNDSGRAEHYQSIASELLQHTRNTAWCGDWYLRGYYDDGTPLGAPGDVESEIDLMAQTWAVIVDPEHEQSAAAMHSVEAKLTDPAHQLIKLLHPPFDKCAQDPGYIKAYPPGVRENGGQYTHAAVWALWAAAERGDYQHAMEWFHWLNPLERLRSDADIETYRLEPYVLPGDVYGTGALTGRGGWSWYTGSAAWLYRFALRRLLGFQRQGNNLYLRPCLAPDWPDIQATFCHHDAVYQIQVHSPGQLRDKPCYIAVNYRPINQQFIPLEASGEYSCHIFPQEDARRRWLEQQETGS